MGASQEKAIQDLIRRGHYQEAESQVAELLNRDEGNADLHYLLGVSAYMQSKIGPAIRELKRALELEPKHTDSAICLSVLYNDIGRYDDAKKVFDTANQSVAHRRTAMDRDIDRKFAVKHLELADMYFRYRRYDDSIEEYTKAAILDSSDAEIRIRRAKAFAKKGYLTRAVQELQQLTNENPRYIPSRLQLGLLYYSQGNLLDAELEWENVLRINPDHREARAYLKMAKDKRSVAGVEPPPPSAPTRPL
jgi:tetratricopeptide (TPR) repeat protein